MNDIDNIGSGWSPLLDQLKEKEGMKSDAALGRRLGVTRSFISAVRGNRKNMSAELGEKLFELLGKQVEKDDLEIFKPLRVQIHTQRRGADPRIRAFVLARSKGHCELCEAPAPFLTLQGQPYLEIHHILPVSSEGRYSAENLVALCPNCHRKVEIRPSDEDKNTLLARAHQVLGME